MTPEMQLAQALGGLPSVKEKLASKMEDFSIEELGQIFKNEKTAKEERDSHPIHPGFIDSNVGVHRAMRSGDKGVGQFVADNDLVGRRLKKGLGHGLVGAAGGALAGALAGGRTVRGYGPKRSAIGALIGGYAGLAHGGIKADKEYLEEKGIKQRWGGAAPYHYTRSAAKKYLSASKEKKAFPLPGSMMATAGRAMTGIMRATPARAALGGAAGGAALGAGRYMMSNDPNKSFMGSVAGGAMLGAGAGAGLQRGLGAVVQRAGQPGMVGAMGTHANRMMAAGAQMGRGAPAAAAAAGRGAMAPKAMSPAAPGMTNAGTTRMPTAAMPGNQAASNAVDRRAAAQSQRARTKAKTTSGKKLPGAQPASMQAYGKQWFPQNQTAPLAQQLKLAGASLHAILGR